MLILTKLIAGVVVFLAGLIAAMALHAWLRTVAVCGLPPFWVIRRMLDIDAKRLFSLVPIPRLHRIKVSLTWLAFAPIGVTLFIYTDSVLAAALTLFVIIFSWFQIAHFSLPPTVLYLSRSRDEAIQDLAEIIPAISPLRVVSLIHPAPDLASEAMNEIEVFERIEFKDILPSIYRTREAADWDEIVRELMYFTPIVIIDTRSVSDAVIFEAELILKSGRADKVLLLTRRDSDAPLLLRLSPEARRTAESEDRFLHPDNLVPVLMDITKYTVRLKKSLMYPRVPWQRVRSTHDVVFTATK